MSVDDFDIRELRHELRHRCVRALRQASSGQANDTDNPMLAGRIAHLHAMRHLQQNPSISPMTAAESQELKALIAYEEEWLAPALLEAAEEGRSLDVAKRLERLRNGWPTNPGRYRVIVAYTILLELEQRPPFIGELLERVGIKKPKRTKENTEEWFRLDRRERVVRKTLKHFNLPLSTSKRGRQKR